MQSQAYTVPFYDLIVIILSITFGSNKDKFKLTVDNFHLPETL